MAPIKLVEVLSFSNEDAKHTADNLLKTDGYQKWKCAVGITAKQVYVILKLECLTLINSIDIGNESSAFVEVLAGREGIDYKVLLPASSFMSPLEARNNTQTNRVRLFPFEKLTKATAEEKWDRVKIICTQPFNKLLQYGLSFVKLHSIDKIDAKKEAVGAFMLNEQNSDEDLIKVGTFFKNFKIETAVKKIDDIKIKRHLESDSTLLNDISRKNQAKKHKSQDSTEIKLNRSLVKESHRTKEKQSQKTEESISESHKTEDIEKKQQTSQYKEQEVKRKFKPFGLLLSDVVFVMSGYQNPKRSEVREKMVELGARYKSDWDQTCTHLLCAFKNTPKYRAIKGKGIIVSEKWTEDCYEHRKRISSTRYLLEKNKYPIAEEIEIWADDILAKNVDSSEKMEKDHIIEKANEISEYEAETEDEDTDDEIKRVITKQGENKQSYASIKESSDEAAYDADTDIDEENQIQNTSKLELPPLPCYFSNKVFYIYGSIGEEDAKLIQRYIIGFNGKLEDYMTKNVHYVITKDSWDQHFDDALSNNENLQFVRPHWIWKCSEKKKIVPAEPYLVVPKEMI